MPDLFCLMFADDIANCAETRNRLQRQLDFILLNHEKMCLKSEVEEIRLNLQQMTIVMRPSC